MSNVDPAYAQYLEKEYAEAARKAQEIAFANQLNQVGQLKAASPQPVPSPEYLELPERELPSTAHELRQELEAAIANYHQAIENAKGFEAKLQAARKAKADALTDDNGDEKKIVKAVSENLGLQQVYSRRAELARQKVPEAFIAILPIAKALAQELTNRCYALAAERISRHRAVFRRRLDLESFHRRFNNSLHGYPVDFESELDQLIECCGDVAAARACAPYLSFLTMRVMPPDLTLEKLQWDLETLEKAEAAYQVEAGREYDFTPQAESQNTEQESELAEQTA